MNRPILHLKKKPAPAATVVAVTVSGAKPTPTPTSLATGKPLQPAPTSTPELTHPVVTSGATTDAAAPPLTLSTLFERFPSCFSWDAPRPLKIGIHRDIVALGYPIKAVRTVLSRYCSRPTYRRALVVDAVRVDLEGGDAGVVTKEEVEGANQAAGLGGSNAEKAGSKSGRPAKAAKAPPTSNNIELEGANIVIGKIEVMCKFSELPKAVPVQGGYRFGIEQDGVQVSVTLNAKAWKKIEAAARDWPAWIAAVSGKVGAVTDGGRTIELAGANVQVFEKKAKAAA